MSNSTLNDDIEVTETPTPTAEDRQISPTDFDGEAFDDVLAQYDAKKTDEEDETDTEDKPQKKLDTKAAVGMVSVGFVVSENLISGITGLPFKYEQGAKQSVLESLEPLIDKHGLAWLGWFEAYKEEIMFSVAFGGLAFTSWTQLKGLKIEKLKELHQEQQKKRVHAVEQQKEAEIEKANATSH
ncbi:hypothetical protein [Vibrio sp. VB16]|uniref:hypothetical protein n=1 Tax=Vibrio sp. VB16 TaxID=2785746 RepID=UPI0018A086A0|nr:hypothetical protein [Vibrio sp. VB16]UGA55298.1 hypothetical protein IUZ65_002800 [Vibrio sp. VB16]